MKNFIITFCAPIGDCSPMGTYTYRAADLATATIAAKAWAVKINGFIDSVKEEWVPTEDQAHVLLQLQARYAAGIAGVIEDTWKRGERFCYDDRNGALKGLKRHIERGNKDAAASHAKG